MTALRLLILADAAALFTCLAVGVAYLAGSTYLALTTRKDTP